MKENMANKSSDESRNPRPMPGWTGMSAKQRAEIGSLKAEIRKMQEAELKYLRVLAECKEQLSWIRARLDEMERLLASATDPAANHQIKAHHARADSQ